MKAIHTRIRVSLFVLLLLVLTLFYLLSHPRTEKPTLKQGDIAPRDVIAPFTFPILKHEEELSLEREAAAERILAVISLDTKKSQEILDTMDIFLNKVAELRKEKEPLASTIDTLRALAGDLTEETLLLLLSPRGKRVVEEVNLAVETVLTMGLIQDKAVLPLGTERRVSVGSEDREYTRGLEEILDMKEAGDFLKVKGLALFPREENLFKTLVELSTYFLRPNLTLNVEETERRREAARAEVKTSRGLVLQGEMIVRAHDPVTKDVADRLRSLSLVLEPARPVSMFLPALGRTVVLALIICVFVGYLLLSQPQVMADFSQLLLISLLGVLTVGLSSLAISFKGVYYYLIPMAFASVLLTLLLNSELALYFTFTVSMLIAVYSGMRLAGPLVALVGGAAAVLSARGVKSRAEFYRPILWVCGANIVAIGSIELFRTSPVSLLVRASLLGVLNGFGSIFLAMGFLPVFERLFKITTDHALLELSDLNRPILRRLALEASGTYHHSLVVASLSEAAARTIGANPLLARVAAYYHDIGKLRKPEYFIENQIGLKNPHNKLTPRMSSLIVSAHVKDGVELAKEEKLPNEIVDSISRHHGTTVMRPFYERAKAQNSDENLSDTDFRYPGPKPQRKEIAIVMLADSIEATARSLDEPTTSRLKGVIKAVIERRLIEGQLDECGLTLKDLHSIGQAFLPILIGVFHPRMDYPREKKDEDSYTEPRTKGKNTKRPPKKGGGENTQTGGSPRS